MTFNHQSLSVHQNHKYQWNKKCLSKGKEGGVLLNIVFNSFVNVDLMYPESCEKISLLKCPVYFLEKKPHYVLEEISLVVLTSFTFSRVLSLNEITCQVPAI